MNSYHKGDRVVIGRSAPRIGIVSPIACDAAVLVRSMRTSFEPTRDYWLVQFASGAQTVASESMMQPAIAS